MTHPDSGNRTVAAPSGPPGRADVDLVAFLAERARPVEGDGAKIDRIVAGAWARIEARRSAAANVAALPRRGPRRVGVALGLAVAAAWAVALVRSDRGRPPPDPSALAAAAHASLAGLEDAPPPSARVEALVAGGGRARGGRR